ncbi:MAG TPA: hypothetical protein VJT74_10260 [Pyrinomonadaceae bacterium]|nr:hypothetical protein [Pyrinomonadaceae bacterium]
MKKVCLLALLLTLTSVVQTRAQDSGLREVTLYAQNKHGFNVENSLFDFETASFVSHVRGWDLVYGTLYAGEDYDWFQVSTKRKTRSAFRDLGELTWNDYFEVPTVEPFPELKEGEERTISVDTSGADGGGGKPGAPGGDDMGAMVLQPQQSMTQTPPPVEQPWLTRAKPAAPPPAPRVKRDGVPKIDPVFVKAVVGHIYVIHVVEGGADYYALFRVESLVRGDRCTISWKLIPPPVESASNQEK